MKHIKYAKPCHFHNYGRNGHMKAHGIAVDDVDGEVVLEPINSRGRSSSACIMVAKDSLPELIAELQDVEAKLQHIANLKKMAAQNNP